MGNVPSGPPTTKKKQLVQTLRSLRPEAIAVALLHAYANPEAEQDLVAALSSLTPAICHSAAVAPRFREFERFSTTVANAALLPVLQNYLAALNERLPDQTITIQQSNGGLTSIAEARRLPVRLVLSGPAGGVHAAEVYLREEQQVGVSFDMGGTSTDVGLIDGRAQRTDQLDIEGRPLLVDSLQVHTIGAGGGSVLWIDRAGALRVGPESAGANPGPACTGSGSRATITDAHCWLGRLPAQQRLAGTVPLDRSRSREVLAPLAKQCQVSPEAVALAALAIADAKMEQAIKKITLENGVDPRAMTLLAFGGAAGLHAARLMQRLSMPATLIPPHPGAASAMGMAIAAPRLDESRAWMQVLDGDSWPRLERHVHELRAELQARMNRELGKGPVDFEIALACRYLGQSYELLVPCHSKSATEFATAHRARYGFELDRPVECVAVHASALRPSAFAPQRQTPRSGPVPRTETTTIWDGAGWVDVPLLDRQLLAPGMTATGPLIVRELTATTIVEPGCQMKVTPTGCLRIQPA